MRATSAEEQEEASPAKKAKHEEQIRVRARDGEEVTLSQDAARLMGTLKDLMDLAPSEDGIYPMPTIMASTLQMVCKLNDPDYTWPSSDEPSLYQLIQLIDDALYLDAPIALKQIQLVIASRLNGKRAPEVGALLGAGGDFGSAEQHVSHAAPVDGQRSDELRKRYSRMRVEELRCKLRKLGLTTDGTKPVLIGRLIEMADAAASNAEPAFVPEDVLEAPQQPASSALPPEPLQQPSFSADAMEAALGLVDVATLAELKGVTRSWRALAQRVLCSRLCRRDGQPVPTRLDEITDLDVEQLIEAGRPGDAAVAGRMLPGLARLHGYGYVVDVAAVRAADLQCEMVGDRRRPSLLHGAAKDALNSCITGEGEPPLRLTIAAVACAGSGVICGIPVQQLRGDSVTELLNLSNRGLNCPAAMLVAYLIPAMSVLTELRLSFNHIGDEGAKAIAEALKVNAEALKVNAVLYNLELVDNAVLTTLHLNENKIGAEGAKAIAEALKVNAVVTTLSLYYNQIGDEGAKAIAESLKVNAVLTTLDLYRNNIGPEGAKAIAEVLKVNAVLTFLQLGWNGIGDEGAKAIAEALKINVVLTSLDLRFNSNMGDAGRQAVRDAVKGRSGFQLHCQAMYQYLPE
jgi:hypothetical protein